MEEGYRVPDIEEFVQGFEFEVASDHSFGIVDTKDDPDNVLFEAQLELNKKRIWNPMKVYWKHDPQERVIEKYGEYTINISGATANFFKPFDVESFLKQGLIRVKI